MPSPEPLTEQEVQGIVRYWEQQTGYYAAPPWWMRPSEFASCGRSGAGWRTTRWTIRHSWMPSMIAIES